MTEEKKETVGQYLRKEREKRNVSLEAVAKVTRITKENLEALEKDDFQVISAPVFVRGFLRNYANFLGLDPKEVIARYDSQTDLLPVPQEKEPPPPPSREENPIFKTLLFLSILLVGVAFSFYYYQKTSGPASSPGPSTGVAPAPAPAGIQPSPSKVTPTKGKTATRPSQPEKGKKPPDKLQAATTPPPDIDQTKEKRHVLRAVAMEKTWVRIIADDQQVSDVLLQPRETSTWTARQKFEITLGNAGGVELFFNGTSQGRLGESGAVLHLVLPKETRPTQPTQGLPVQKVPLPKDFKPAPPVSSLPLSKEEPLKETRSSPGDVSEKNKPSPEPPPKETKPPESVPARENNPPDEDQESLKNLR